MVDATWRVRWMTVALSLWVLLALLPWQAALAADKPAAAAEPSAVDAEKILLQVDRKLQPDSCELFAQVTNQLANGRTSQVSFYGVRGHGKRSALILLTPDELAGRALLRLEDEVWMHVPGELALRQSSLTQSLVGGVFNNADLLLTDYSVDYKATLLEESEDSYLLSLLPRRSGGPYTKLVMRVDRKLLLPKTVMQYGANNQLIKTITFSKTGDSFGFPRPAEMQTASEMNKLYAATWQLGSIKARTFPAEAFSKAFLPKVGTLFK
ncbi:MAG: outer membrane lipoprotein-sorting protein [Magnetococcales bacterium]|nr:outer membrane lipoprotein-sorting protein [Magnetococcales bacterium]